MLTLSLPEPILFHPLKHHLQYIRQFTNEAETWPGSEIRAALKTIGASQLDLYTGSLTPQQIAEETLAYLEAQKLLHPEAYLQYLSDSGNNFQVISLSDKTDWVLRWGLQENRYVHLHPARYACNTMRVKAATLKTAIAVTIAAKQLVNRKIDLQLVNQVREEWLELSPLKDFGAEENSARLFRMIFS